MARPVPISRRFTSSLQIDLARSLSALAFGRTDPTIRITATEVHRATRTPEGPAAQRIRLEGDSVTVEAWGAGAEWLLDSAPDLVGANDYLMGFSPEHPRVAEYHRRLPGLRIVRSKAIFEMLVTTILAQKVTGRSAKRSFAGLVNAYGEPAPGPLELTLPVDPEVLRYVEYEDLHRFDVERKRADILRRVAALAPRLERLPSTTRQAAAAALGSIHGIGPWTIAHVMRGALGDPDAVEIGDFHLPNTVAWHLCGRPRGTEEEMLEALAPFAGHRGRVIRLIETGGGPAPRRGPRMEARRIAGI